MDIQPNYKDDFYQKGYSEYFAQYQFDPQRQTQKAEKTLSVLRDYYGGAASLRNLDLLDIGCSAGLMTAQYGKEFRRIVGIDIDEPAIKYAMSNFASQNMEFYCVDAMDTGFESETFDVVTCTHIYEHVPDAVKLMAEIYRVLKKGGICYFAAQNRITFIEPHYFLPFLSILPKPLGHAYYRLFGKGDYYYEKLVTLGELRKLVRNFEIIDYTKRILENPEKFHATELLRSGSFKQKTALMIIKYAYFLCPTYIWLLKKV